MQEDIAREKLNEWNNQAKHEIERVKFEEEM